MSEQETEKQVEIKIYLSKFENVAKFIECLDIEKEVYRLYEAKKAFLNNPSEEALLRYADISSTLFEINTNLINIMEAFIKTRPIS